LNLGVVPTGTTDTYLYRAEIRKDGALMKLLEHKRTYLTIYGILAYPLLLLPNSEENTDAALNGRGEFFNVSPSEKYSLSMREGARLS